MLDALWVRTGGHVSLGLKVRLLGDRRLCLIIMQKPRPQKKRGQKRAPTEMPSSATREVIQVVQKGTRIVKKRVIEKIEFDSRPLPSPFSGGGPPNTLGSQADPPHSSCSPVFIFFVSATTPTFIIALGWLNNCICEFGVGSPQGSKGMGHQPSPVNGWLGYPWGPQCHSRGKYHSPSITGLPQMFPSHQNISGRMIKCGKCFPRHPTLPDGHLSGPTTHIWSIYFGWLI